MTTYPSGSNRYRIAQLIDARLLALDTKAPNAYLLTPKSANGTYRLSRSGSLSVNSGTIAGVEQPASCGGYRVERLPLGQVRVSRPTEPAWQITVGSRQAGGQKHRFAILDLQGGGLLLVTADGASELRVALAPDGTYRHTGGGVIAVRGGTSAASGGDPVLQLAEDFAP
jgi:hypothetical protein